MSILPEHFPTRSDEAKVEYSINGFYKKDFNPIQFSSKSKYGDIDKLAERYDDSIYDLMQVEITLRSAGLDPSSSTYPKQFMHINLNVYVDKLNEDKTVQDLADGFAAQWPHKKSNTMKQPSFYDAFIRQDSLKRKSDVVFNTKDE